MPSTREERLTTKHTKSTKKNAKEGEGLSTHLAGIFFTL